MRVGLSSQGITRILHSIATTLTALLPAGLAFNSASQSYGACTNEPLADGVTKVVCPLGDFTPWDAHYLSINTTVSAPRGATLQGYPDGWRSYA